MCTHTGTHTHTQRKVSEEVVVHQSFCGGCGRWLGLWFSCFSCYLFKVILSKWRTTIKEKHPDHNPRIFRKRSGIPGRGAEGYKGQGWIGQKEDPHDVQASDVHSEVAQGANPRRDRFEEDLRSVLTPWIWAAYGTQEEMWLCQVGLDQWEKQISLEMSLEVSQRRMHGWW